MGGNRGGKKTSAGCGYKVKDENDGKIIIYPTKNSNKCDITVTIGNAEITFDPENPPDELTKIITGEHDGDFSPPVDITHSTRLAVSFDDIEDVERVINDRTYEFKKVNGYTQNAVNFSASNSVLFQTESGHKGQKLGDYSGSGSIYDTVFNAGNRPYASQSLDYDFTEATSGGNQFATISYGTADSRVADMRSFDTMYLKIEDGSLVISNNTSFARQGGGTNLNIKFPDEYNERDVIEFTFIENSNGMWGHQKFNFLIKNIDGYALEGVVFYNGSNATYKFIKEFSDVMKVAGGEIMFHKKGHFALDGDENYLPVGTTGSPDSDNDEILDLNSGFRKTRTLFDGTLSTGLEVPSGSYLVDAVTDIRYRTIGSTYYLFSNGELYKDNSKILSDCVALFKTPMRTKEYSVVPNTDNTDFTKAMKDNKTPLSKEFFINGKGWSRVSAGVFEFHKPYGTVYTNCDTHILAVNRDDKVFIVGDEPTEFTDFTIKDTLDAVVSDGIGSNVCFKKLPTSVVPNENGLSGFVFSN